MSQLKPRSSWKNHIEDQVAEPLRIYEPKNLEELIDIVKEAEKTNSKVKPVGSGHSWSDICKTNGFLIRPDLLNKHIPKDVSILKPNVDKDNLIKVESGITIRKLNDTLERAEKGLFNMGGYDGQTIVGATATATHGSGIKYGPLSEMIQAIEIVGSHGKLYRIESSEGISNPNLYRQKYPNFTLIQDDDYFEAAKVSLGCIGVIYAVIIRVRSFYYLKETRTLKSWSKIKTDLISGDILNKHDHYEILIHPYLKDKDYKCLVTIREECPKPDNLPKDKLRRNVLIELFSRMGIVTKTLKRLFDKKPTWTEELLEKSIEGLEDDAYINKSYKVYNIGEANHIPSYSSEIALPVADNKYIDGIEHMLTIMDKNRKIGQLYQTAPIALRFVKGCNSMMAPQYKSDTCMVEIIMIKDAHGGKELYEILENELYKFGGRPHWGQFNYVTRSKIEKYNLYPEIDKWKKVKDHINSTGVFDNFFASKIGVDV